ncbi:MAG: hypothetical protein Q4C20_04740 [Erysipelotrichaceae bacterium]|nr:hypothetical protein [Erysipelotrichaceae bacterium]
MQETPSPTFSSAGKEVISVTKKAADTIQKEADKAAGKLHQEENSPDDSKTEKKPQENSNSGTETSRSSRQQEVPTATPVPQQATVPDPTPEPTPEPEPEPVYEEPVYQEPVPTPAPPPQPCPGGKNPDLGCEVILDSNYYRETFGSYNEAMVRGQYYMDEVMYIGDIEITSYSVQEVYRNDHSIAYYGLKHWLNGSLIQ